MSGTTGPFPSPRDTARYEVAQHIQNTRERRRRWKKTCIRVIKGLLRGNGARIPIFILISPSVYHFPPLKLD